METQKRNPNSQKRLRLLNSSSSWSELPPDLFNSVFERLGFADFRRADSVCSSWCSGARRCVTKQQSLCLILLPDEDDDKNNHSCTLFNPEEKGKLYKIRDLGVEFAKSVCLATFGNWLFMRDHRYNFYFVNIFNHDRIALPHVESQLGTTKLERTEDDWFRISKEHDMRESKGIDIRSPVFWIDDKTKDYLVVWGFGKWCVVYSRRGDKFWNQIPVDFSCTDMVYKNHRLYLLNQFGSIKIFDLSQEAPRETFHGNLKLTKFERMSKFDRPPDAWLVSATKLVVTVSGDLLKVEKIVRYESRIWSFRVYKVCSSRVSMKHKRVESLGHEAMLFDLGITVLANDIEGLKRNHIYFSFYCREKNTTEICVFNLETEKMESLQKFDCSSPQQLARARWFLPSFKRK